MRDIFAKPLNRETVIRRMAAGDVVRLVDATRKALPRTMANKWHHGFLQDIFIQLDGGYRLNLSPKQVGHFLRCADLASVFVGQGNFQPQNKENSHAPPERRHSQN
jgi:hypothetical protein